MNTFKLLLIIYFSSILSLSTQNNPATTENIPTRICFADNHYQHTIDSTFLLIKIDSIKYSVTHFYPSGNVEFQMMVNRKLRVDTTYVFDENTFELSTIFAVGFIFIADGSFDSWHENNQKYMSGNFSNCAKNGLWKYYDTCGVLAFTELWENEHLITTIFENQYTDLRQRINSPIFSITNDLLDDNFILQNDSNDTIQKFNKSMYVYELGTDSLLLRFPGDNFQKKYTAHLIQKWGSDFTYVLDGATLKTKKVAIRCSRFLADGPYTSYWPNDSIYESGNFNLGYRNGVWLKYDETGKIISNTTWKNGKIIDLHTY